MYEVKTIKAKEFKFHSDGKVQTLTLGGIPVSEDAQKTLCEQQRVPYTLFGFQDRTPVPIIEPVLQTLADLKAVIDTDKNTIESFVHPNKEFVSDEEFQLVKETLDSQIMKEFDLFGLDVFTAQTGVSRPLTGGITFNQDLVRLACINGLKVFHPQCSTHFRTLPDLKTTNTAIEKVTDFDSESFMTSVFGTDCQRPASVTDLLNMASASGLPKDEIGSYFPTELIRTHYLNKGYDIDKLSSKTLSNLKAGVSYYDAFNFLTYVISHKIPQSERLERQIYAAKFLSKKAAKDYEHLLLADAKVTAPVIDPALIVQLKGDVNF
jgi:hypothetical protein